MVFKASMTIIFGHLIGTFAPPIIARAQAARYGKAVLAKELNSGESLGVISQVIGCK
jgi:hypothetical protein